MNKFHQWKVSYMDGLGRNSKITSSQLMSKSMALKLAKEIGRHAWIENVSTGEVINQSPKSAVQMEAEYSDIHGSW